MSYFTNNRHSSTWIGNPDPELFEDDDHLIDMASTFNMPDIEFEEYLEALSHERDRKSQLKKG